MKHVLFLFLDGVGLGKNDPEHNPFATAHLPTLKQLIAADWFDTATATHNANASFIPTDANLGITGRPQSATGQATIVTGKNVSAAIGEHYGPKPNPAIRAILQQENVFKTLIQQQKLVRLGKAYPPGYFEAIASGKRLHSAIPTAAVAAGVKIPTLQDYIAGFAFADDYTGQIWHDKLNIPNAPIYTHAEAGKRMAALSQQTHLLFYEHWLTDYIGHKRNMPGAIKQLEDFDAVLTGILAHWDYENGLIIVSSDHGNMEDLSVRTHTRNQVPTLLIGANQQHYAKSVVDLTDLTPLILAHLTA